MKKFIMGLSVFGLLCSCNTSNQQTANGDFKYCTCDERCNIQKEINKISKGCLTLIKILKNKETK